MRNLLQYPVSREEALSVLRKVVTEKNSKFTGEIGSLDYFILQRFLEYAEEWITEDIFDIKKEIS